jgi:hypothetical protein
MAQAPEFVTVADAAETLATKPFPVLQLCESGDLDSHLDDDGRRLVRATSVQAYADRQGAANA